MKDLLRLKTKNKSIQLPHVTVLFEEKHKKERNCRHILIECEKSAAKTVKERDKIRREVFAYEKKLFLTNPILPRLR